MLRKLAIVAILLAPATAAAQASPGGYTPPPNRQGLTFEANLGLGFFWVSSDGESSDTETAIGGLDLAVGTFLKPKMAITGRIAGVTYSEDGGSITEVFFGPSLQYWATRNVWVGGGVGLGIVRVSIDSFGSDSETGLALDGRVGYTFNPDTKHTFNVSLEWSPAFVEDATWHGLAILGGYQFM
jgi:hypothetical protein